MKDYNKATVAKGIEALKAQYVGSVLNPTTTLRIVHTKQHTRTKVQHKKNMFFFLLQYNQKFYIIQLR